MAGSSGNAKIVLIGNDSALAYLVGRYAERGGYDVIILQAIPSAQELCQLQPAAILFPSLEGLEIAQALILELTDCSIPIMVCSSTVDEARALELGADYCLAHPLTYEGFLAAITAAKARQADQP